MSALCQATSMAHGRPGTLNLGVGRSPIWSPCPFVSILNFMRKHFPASPTVKALHYHRFSSHHQPSSASIPSTAFYVIQHPQPPLALQETSTSPAQLGPLPRQYRSTIQPPHRPLPSGDSAAPLPPPLPPRAFA
jgi:hypothetical protein